MRNRGEQRGGMDSFSSIRVATYTKTRSTPSVTLSQVLTEAGGSFLLIAAAH